MRTPVLGYFPRIQFFAAILVLTLLLVPSIVRKLKALLEPFRAQLKTRMAPQFPALTSRSKILRRIFRAR
jgi:hypothetical protein